MPRITIDYDSDSSFERDHLRLATHHQILTQYLSGKNDKKQPPKEKVVRLEHGSEKAFLALKRAEIKLGKANEEITQLKEKIESNGTDAGLRQQLNLEREKNTNRELKRELLVYEGVLPPYSKTQGTSWLDEKRMKWTCENRELWEMKDAEQQNTKMNAYLERNQIVHTVLNAPAPNHIVKLAEENMVLKAKWEKKWELTAGKREKQELKGDEKIRKDKELHNDSSEAWKERKDEEIQPQYQKRQESRCRKKERDNDFELCKVERVVVMRSKRRPPSSS